MYIHFIILCYYVFIDLTAPTTATPTSTAAACINKNMTHYVQNHDDKATVRIIPDLLYISLLEALDTLSLAVGSLSGSSDLVSLATQVFVFTLKAFACVWWNAYRGDWRELAATVIWQLCTLKQEEDSSKLQNQSHGRDFSGMLSQNPASFVS